MSSLWRNNGFLRLWGAHTASLLGSQVTLISLPLTALLVLDASPFEVGVLTATGYLPFLLIGLPAGVWARRMPLRRVLLGADLGRALLLLGIPIAFRLDALSLPLLLPITFFVGALTVMADIAHQSILPALVDRAQLADGNTKLQLSHSSTELCGPALGGLLVNALGAPIAVVVDAVSFVVSALLIGGVSPRPEEGDADDADEGTLGAQVREGLAYVGRHPLLRPIVLCMAGANLFDMFGMVLAILPVYLTRDLALSPARMGAILALANVGALAGALANERVVRRLGVGATLIASSFLPGVGVLLLPLATPETAVWVVAPALALAGFGIALFNVNQMSLRQHVTPAKLLTRMNATVRFVIWGMIPVGAFLGGLLAGAVGTRRTLVIAGVGSLFATLPLFFSRVRSLRAMPEPCRAAG